MNTMNKKEQTRLPLKLDIRKSAIKKLNYSGIYSVPLFEQRLSGAVESINSDVSVEFFFDVDHENKAFVKGSAVANVTLCCQRCNTDFDTEIGVEFLFSPVKDISISNSLPDGYEPIVVDEWGEVDILHAIEDEFLLALPISPMHEITECNVSDIVQTFGTIEDEKPKENPFAVLAQLKKDK